MDATALDHLVPCGASRPAAELADADRRLHGLSDAELLALLLAPGCLEADSLRLSHDLLSACGGLAALPGASCAALRHHGLSRDQASALLAACELARRFAREDLPDRITVNRSAALARYLILSYYLPDQEVLGAVFLDASHHLLADREIFRGTFHRVVVEPRQILKEASCAAPTAS